jgi:hypothetical protein
MKEVIIRYGIDDSRDTRKIIKRDRSGFYAEIIGIQNSYTVEGDSEIMCVRIVEEKIKNPDKVKIKYERFDKIKNIVILAE